MLKIQIASDLHCEFLKQKFADYPPIPRMDADVLVLAGDIHRKGRALAAFADWPVPVVYVHGNHEMYKEHLYQHLEKLRDATKNSSVHFLERDECVINGVRFLGCCLWTDYQLYGDVEAAMDLARETMNDHRLIRTHYRAFLPKDAAAIHRLSRAWLEQKLNEPFAGKTVVVTHHGPHPGSIPPEYKEDLLTAAYISDLTPLMGKAALWIHGHVHTSVDYMVNGTRVVANPRGYPTNSPRNFEDLRWENPSFNPSLVVEV